MERDFVAFEEARGFDGSGVLAGREAVQSKVAGCRGVGASGSHGDHGARDRGVSCAVGDAALDGARFLRDGGWQQRRENQTGQSDMHGSRISQSEGASCRALGYADVTMMKHMSTQPRAHVLIRCLKPLVPAGVREWLNPWRHPVRQLRLIRYNHFYRGEVVCRDGLSY